MKFTDRVLQNLQLKAKTKGTYASFGSEFEPPIIGSTTGGYKKHTSLLAKVPSQNFVPYSLIHKS
jgi:hypothetical protein